MNEEEFQAGIRATPWFSEFKQQYGEEPNLNDPSYDYRRAWAAGARPDVRDPTDKQYHWPSEFKGASHPNRFVQGVDTITGRPMGWRDYIADFLARGGGQVPPLTGAMYPREAAPYPRPSPPELSSDMMQRPLPPVPPLTGAMYPKEIKRRK